MSELTEHYRRLLGLDGSWEVTKVDFSRMKSGWRSRSFTAADGQFETRIRAAVPRSDCSACGVKTVAVPGAGKHSRFTLFFEAFAVGVLKACANVKRAALLLRIDWQAAYGIMELAVERGLKHRQTDQVVHVGIDEKSLGRGQDYVSVMVDLDGNRVVEVAEERTEEDAEKLWKTPPEEQRKRVRAVAMDMWQPYFKATQRSAPEAEIVHDKFHVSKHLNEAVDQVRRRERRQLKEDGDDRLTGSKQLWLYNRTNLKGAKRRELDDLKNQDLKTGRAWALKENFRHFWKYVYASSAADFFVD